ncbi:MAG: peptide chain release factor N(5)-glutamine methyltransferase [Vicinamibacterales bacterium]
MQIGDLVALIGEMLAAAGVPHATAEARDLVAAVSEQSRFWPSLHSQVGATPRVVDLAQSAARRRASGMPFAYAVGRAPFRHLTLRVDERVLIPRQETEVLVDLVLRHRHARGGVAADVGTGSGAIALALASEGHFDRIVATDVAADAIALARDNANVLADKAAVVAFRTGDLLAPLVGATLDVLVSNPPYIAFDEAAELPASVRDWEPGHALFSGEHGLAATRRIIDGAPALLCNGGLLALEVDSRRGRQVAGLVASGGAFNEIELHQDLAGRDRFVLAVRN